MSIHECEVVSKQNTVWDLHQEGYRHALRPRDWRLLTGRAEAGEIGILKKGVFLGVRPSKGEIRASTPRLSVSPIAHRSAAPTSSWREFTTTFVSACLI